MEDTAIKTEDLSVKRRQIMEELYRRKTEEKFKYYEPIGKVSEFLDKFGGCNYLVSALIAANGIGKTTVLANIVANLSFPGYNKYFDQKLFTSFPFHIKKGRIVSDPTTVKETLIPALKEWLPVGRYKTERAGKSYDYRFIMDTGWTWDIMTFDQDPKEFESANLSVILLDEPPPYSIYAACIARLRKGGVMGVLCTPLSGSAWLYDEFAAHPDLESKHRSLVTAKMEDACIEHGIRGFLEHEQIDRLVENIPKDELLPRFFGKFQHLSGLVFKQWSRDVHVIKPFQINFLDWCVYEAYDIHPRNPDAILWVAVNRKGRKIVIDELYINAPMAEIVARIKERRRQYRVVKAIIDPIAFVEDQHKENPTENSLAKVLSNVHKLDYVPASKRRTDAVRAIQEALDYKPETDTTRGYPPALEVFDICTRLIYEMEHWQWSEWTGKTKDRKSPNEKPQDKDDHLIEDLGRILLEDPVFEEYVEEIETNPYLNEVNYDPYAK